ncbi:MAG: formate dehydrogenase subunit alpha [Planctomycetes bacterium]|nr:formate dehydrogenase subunit alpha [Planctomycetota bacterium]
MIALTLDGQVVTVEEGTTLWEAARQVGIHVPTLCHSPGLRPVGVCRVCAVEVKGARVLAPSCVRLCEDQMVVSTRSEKVLDARRMLIELLLADHPSPCSKHRDTGDCELELLAQQEGIGRTRFTPRSLDDAHDLSSPAIAVDHSACILCDRCIRACTDVQSNEVIGRALKGAATRISFDDRRPMGKSSCVFCGECVAACPTGALWDKPLSAIGIFRDARKVDSICPYCGVGCGVTFHVKANTIVRVSGRPTGPANLGRLCVKGRYGFDYALHAERLTVPLVRLPEYSKRPEGYASPRAQFREATWEEALDLAARTFRRVREESGPSALAGFGSAKGSNEEAYLFQKLVRAGFGTNNVDHCTRLCHASSVAALMETIGSGAVSNIFQDVLLADCALVIGSNTTENHPVAATFIKRARKDGLQLIVMDVRKVDLARHADLFLQFQPGTDVALLNGLLRVILEEQLEDREFIQARTENSAAVRDAVQAYTPELVEKITGVPASLVIQAARTYGRARNAMVFWGMGVSQHTTGTDNARCLINLCLMTGNIGRPGTGLHPLRGQNNVQGASDAGLIPMVFPGYQNVDDPVVRARFEKAWGVALDPQKGLTVVEIMSAVLDGKIRAMYMLGENPFLSDPNINKVKKALARMEFLCVQDIFLTETAEYADVVLPASAFAEKLGTFTNTDRRVQLGRPAIQPPGQARQDWEIICEIAGRMGFPMSYPSVREVFDEFASLTPSYAGLTYDRLERETVLWPCPTPGHSGTSVLFSQRFPTPNGRGRLVPVQFAPPKELPDDQFPLYLNTGRNLLHWHTGTMTRRAKALDTICPEPYVEVHEADLMALGVKNGDYVRLVTRRGQVQCRARVSPRPGRGSVFLPFHFKEAAANLLTIDALDPYGKIPEFKCCAVRLERV